MRLEFPRRKLTRTELCGWKNSLVLMVAGADPENYSRGGGCLNIIISRGAAVWNPPPDPLELRRKFFCQRVRNEIKSSPFQVLHLK